MGRRLNPHDEELYRRTDEVLHYIWDPCGSSREPMARDEYQSYVPQVFSLLKQHHGQEQLAEYLAQMENERMGFQTNPQSLFEVASVLIRWRETLAQKYASDGSNTK